MAAVELRYARHGEYDRISRFLDEYWAQEHVYVRSQPLFDWTFGRANHWHEDGYTFAVAESNGELAGILGGIPFTLNEFGRKSKAVWIVNYVIRPDHRRGPAALQLLSKFRCPPFETVVAFGINPVTSAIYKVLRGTVLPGIPRYFAVMPDGVERMMELLSIAHPDWPAERTRVLAEGFGLRGIPDVGTPVTSTIPDTWDRENWPRFARETVGPERDLDYLSWRYLRHPLFEYRVIAADAPGGPGIAVWRLETIRRKTENGLVDVDRLARLVELLPSSAAGARILIAAFLQQAAEAGAMGADFYGYHGCTRRYLRQAGFSAVDELPDGEGVPSRFQPLDGKGGGIMSAMFAKPGLPACSFDPACVWYWTKSDSDQDRPN